MGNGRQRDDEHGNVTVRIASADCNRRACDLDHLGFGQGGLMKCRIEWDDGLEPTEYASRSAAERAIAKAHRWAAVRGIWLWVDGEWVDVS
jgi:hypothetical protein